MGALVTELCEVFSTILFARIDTFIFELLIIPVNHMKLPVLSL